MVKVRFIYVGRDGWWQTQQIEANFCVTDVDCCDVAVIPRSVVFSHRTPRQTFRLDEVRWGALTHLGAYPHNGFGYIVMWCLPTHFHYISSFYVGQLYLLLLLPHLYRGNSITRLQFMASFEKSVLAASATPVRSDRQGLLLFNQRNQCNIITNWTPKLN